ncbi:hypothetical protein F4802DRAFT_19390 [Xylaria palmicola]|nr:hypothetical protein F4802DRAFT_19390 [Xylaria palmicola]
MKLTDAFCGMGIAKLAVLASIAIPGSAHLSSPVSAPNLQKRDAYTCYGHDANTTHCQGALDQLRDYKDENFEVYSGICLNWSHDSCNVRFCAQPYVLNTVNRTASWIYHWANDSLMGCVRDGQYALMGDSSNLNGNGGTYRLHIEHVAPRHG